MGISIREATLADADAIARVQAEAMVGSVYYDESVSVEHEAARRLPRIAGYLAGTYSPSHADAPRATFVARSDDSIVGFIAGHESTRLGATAELQWMFVRPDDQRQGVGGRLLEPLARWFVARSATRVIIDAPPENPYRAFYLKHGAIPFDAYWLYWPDIGRIV